MDKRTLARANEILKELEKYERNLRTFAKQKQVEMKPDVSFKSRIKSWFIERRGDEELQCGVKANLNEYPHTEFIGYLELDNDDMEEIRKVLIAKHDRLHAEFEALGGAIDDEKKMDEVL